MSQPDTDHEIVFPVRTWADYCRDAELARPILEETNEIPATEPPSDLYQPTPEELERLWKELRPQ